MDKNKLLEKYNSFIFEYGKIGLEIKERKSKLKKIEEEISRLVIIIKDIFKEEEEKQKAEMQKIQEQRESSKSPKEKDNIAKLEKSTNPEKDEPTSS